MGQPVFLDIIDTNGTKRLNVNAIDSIYRRWDGAADVALRCGRHITVSSFDELRRLLMHVAHSASLSNGEFVYCPADSITEATESRDRPAAVATPGEPPNSPGGLGARAPKVYLAASWNRRDLMRAYRDRLAQRGIECTSRWLDGPAGAHPGVASLMDLNDIRRADVMLTSGGRHFECGFECGFAFAIGKKIVVIGPRENVFHHLRQIHAVESLEAAIAVIELFAPVLGYRVAKNAVAARQSHLEPGGTVTVTVTVTGGYPHHVPCDHQSAEPPLPVSELDLPAPQSLSCGVG